MPHILFLTQILPYPLDAGAKVRGYHVLQHLADRHRVTLVSFWRDTDLPDAVHHLRTLCESVHTVLMKRSRLAEAVSLTRSFLTGQPYTILRDGRQEMQRLLGEITAWQRFDAIHADQLAMAQYAQWAMKGIMSRASSKPHMVLDAHNAYYRIPERLAQATRNPVLKGFLQREARLMARYEAETYRRFDQVLTVTEEDHASIRSLYARGNGTLPRFTAMPICVDTSTEPLERQPDAKGVLMLGGLHWPPNADGTRWFAHEVWPLVRAQIPQAQFFVVGARPSKDLRALGDCVGIERPEQARDAPVIVTGYIADPQPFIRASAALVVPLRSGGGMRVKIIEAMQWGLPVVSTSIGCEGIHAVPGRDLLIADTPRAFADAVIRVIQDKELAKALSFHGQRLVETEYDWRTVYRTLDAVYADTMAPMVTQTPVGHG